MYNYALSDEVAEGSNADSGTLEMKAHESMITVGLATLGDGSRIGRSLAASGEDDGEQGCIFIKNGDGLADHLGVPPADALTGHCCIVQLKKLTLTGKV